MIRPNLWNILSFLFVLYISHSIWTLYGLFHPQVCVGNHQKCLQSLYLGSDGKLLPLQLRVYLSTSKQNPFSGGSSKEAVFTRTDIDAEEAFDHTININIPQKTRNNGSLYAHSFLIPAKYVKADPNGAPWHVLRTSEITTFMVPAAKTFSLISEDTNQTDVDEKTNNTAVKNEKTRPVTHLRSILTLATVAEPVSFEWRNVPGEIIQLIVLQPDTRRYLPIFTVNELSFRVKDLVEVTSESRKLNLTVRYEPVSVGKLRLLITALHSLAQLKSLGFTEKDTDEVKSIFTDTNFYFLALTFFVAAVHLVLDFLAFKNDIHFWRGRKTMVGLSSRALLWRCFSSSVIFLYLYDESTSLLVLIPSGVAVLIECWKVKKAFKISIQLVNYIPRFRVGTQSAAEVETENIDSQGMKYLSLVLAPLCVGGAIYSLMYVPHKSWYSWFIQCMANGVYAFGFLFMLPQLFVNYKMKSVAHLPWRAFMYKAFNTFIDDLFAFIITMPTAHRMACFRDDVVFVVYLYQRYLYPVDYSRVNEFGESFEEDTKKKN